MLHGRPYIIKDNVGLYKIQGFPDRVWALQNEQKEVKTEWASVLMHVCLWNTSMEQRNVKI